MTAAEFVLWQSFYRRTGFDADRIEWTTANAGAATARAFGSKVKPEDLVAAFGEAGSTSGEIMAFFDGLAAKPGANGEQ